MPTKAKRPPPPILTGQPIGSGAVARVEPESAQQQLVRQLGGGDRGLGLAFLTDALAARTIAPKGDERKAMVLSVAALVGGLAPVDVAESALCAQMVACHEFGMRLLGRAAHQSDDEISGALATRALRLLGAYRAGLEALDRHRSRGKSRTVRIEHVHVNAGGQAIIGAVGIPSTPPLEK